MLAFKRYGIIPVGSVKKNTLVLVQARNGRVPPVVEDTAGVDQNIALVLDDLPSVQVLDRYIIATLGVVPVCADDLVAGFDVLLQTVFSRKAVKVVKDFFGRGVDLGPI